MSHQHYDWACSRTEELFDIHHFVRSSIPVGANPRYVGLRREWECISYTRHVTDARALPVDLWAASAPSELEVACSAPPAAAVAGISISLARIVLSAPCPPPPSHRPLPHAFCPTRRRSRCVRSLSCSRLARHLSPSRSRSSAALSGNSSPYSTTSSLSIRAVSVRRGGQVCLRICLSRLAGGCSGLVAVLSPHWETRFFLPEPPPRPSTDAQRPASRVSLRPPLTIDLPSV